MFIRAKAFIFGISPLPPCLGLVPAFMSDQRILASFTVIILSLDSGSLSAGSSFGHTPLCFHTLIGFLGKEGCISLTLPASCCAQQQSKASLHLLHGTKRFPFTGLCSFVEESSVKYLSRELSSLLSLGLIWLRYTNSFAFVMKNRG